MEVLITYYVMNLSTLMEQIIYVEILKYIPLPFDYLEYI